MLMKFNSLGKRSGMGGCFFEKPDSTCFVVVLLQECVSTCDVDEA